MAVLADAVRLVREDVKIITYLWLDSSTLFP